MSELPKAARVVLTLLPVPVAQVAQVEPDITAEMLPILQGQMAVAVVAQAVLRAPEETAQLPGLGLVAPVTQRASRL